MRPIQQDNSQKLSKIIQRFIIISMKKITVLILLCFLIQNAIIKLPSTVNQEDPPQNDPTQDNPQNDQPQDTPTQDDPDQGDPTQDGQDDQTPPEDNPDEDNPPQNDDNPDQNDPSDQNPQQDPQQDPEQDPNDPPTDDTPTDDTPTDDTPTDQIITLFNEFKQQYGRTYSSEQNTYRLSIFQQNVQKINAHNSNQEKTYTQGINKFADLTYEQYLTHLMSGLGSQPPMQGEIVFADEDFDIEDVQPIDYRKLSAVNSVKDQGQCGACWAFSVISTIQSNFFLKNKTGLPILSEQHFVDCCPKKVFDCNGCNGTWPGAGLEFSAAIGNVYDKDYPYVAKVQACKTTVSAKKYLQAGTPYLQMKGLKDTLFYFTKKGPVSVTIDATKIGFYQSGIFNDCPTSNLVYNHAMVVVGIEAGNVWIIRNSWGPTWGEKGYIRFAPGNSCGMTDWVLFPKIG